MGFEIEGRAFSGRHHSWCFQRIEAVHTRMEDFNSAQDKRGKTELRMGDSYRLGRGTGGEPDLNMQSLLPLKHDVRIVT